MYELMAKRSSAISMEIKKISPMNSRLEYPEAKMAVSSLVLRSLLIAKSDPTSEETGNILIMKLGISMRRPTKT